MFRQINVTPAGLTDNRKTASVKPSQNSEPSTQIKLASRAVERLLSFYPPLDVIEPKSFIAGVIAVLSRYPEELMRAAVAPDGIPMRVKNLRNLAEIEDVCRDLYEPIERRLLREAVENAPKRLPAPLRSAEQQEQIDQQVARVRARFGISQAT
jgi:hypothetical protein